MDTRNADVQLPGDIPGGECRHLVEREHVLMASLPELSERILNQARDHGRVTIREIVTLTGANRNTLKLLFRALVRDQRLVRHGTGRGSWYALP